MPADLFKRIDLGLIYPPFLERMLAMIAELRDLHAEYFYATLGFRTYVEQAKLYFQGRTQPGRIVTWAKPGESPHCFGLAIDFVPSSQKDHLDPDWESPYYDLLGPIARKYGLVWGGDWNHPDRPTKKSDRPHVQVPKYLGACDLAAFRSIRDNHPDDFLKRCWKVIDDEALFA